MKKSLIGADHQERGYLSAYHDIMIDSRNYRLITKVMPVFNQVFKQLGSEMTGPSRAIRSYRSLS